jgi:putative ABC transport system permease protein
VNMLIKLAVKSLRDRKGSVLLSVIAMTVSIFVLLGVEHIRYQTKESFANTVSGTDLIVGARTGSLNLLLYSVFKIGSPTNNISWRSFEKIARNPKVKWVVPLSLGDSHKGFRVLGTDQRYFEHFSYGNQHHLLFEKGSVFDDVFDMVLGYQVADKLGYQLGDKIVLAHGIAKTSFSLHTDKPFTIVGILAPTGTPVDQTLHVSLQGIEAIHSSGENINASQTTSVSKESHQHKQPEYTHLQPKSITALMLGLKSKMSTFKIQREINNDTQEPLLAILPGVALSELWQMMRILENTLFLVSVLVFISASLGVSAMLLSSIKQRTKEIQLLRVIGAPPLFLFFLIELEALFIATISSILGAVILIISLLFAQSYLASYFGLQISVNIFSINTLKLIAGILGVSLIAATMPSIIGYVQSKKYTILD